MPEQSEIKQGYKNKGDYNPTDRIGQKSLFGARKDKNYWEKSIGERWMNMVTDRLHLTSPPSHKDGYGSERATEVPLRESAAGKEAERAVGTLSKIGLGAAAVANPVGTGLGLAGAYGAVKGANYGLDLIDKHILNPRGLQYGTTPRSVISTAVTIGGFKSGDFVGSKVPVTFNSRSYNFGANTPIGKALIKSDYTPYKFELLGDQLKHNVWKALKRRQGVNKNISKGAPLGNGSEADVFANRANPNTVIKVQHYGLVLPRKYHGELGTHSSNVAEFIAQDIANIKNKGAYTADIIPVSPQTVGGKITPTFIQEKMLPVKSMNDVTPKQTRALTRLMMNSKPYADAHLGNIAMDSNGMFWFIDAPLKSKIDGGFTTGSVWRPRESYSLPKGNYVSTISPSIQMQPSNDFSNSK